MGKITVEYLEELDGKVFCEEITKYRMVELLNEKASEPEWNLSSEILPSLGSNVEYSEDGIIVEGTLDYISERRCMMAGISGGHGYFGEGFATDGENGCDRGLICDAPKYWRYSSLDAPTK